MATVLYRRQKQIVNFLNRYIEKFGHAPTLVEIAKHLGVRSLATVHEHLQVLEKKGLIKKISGISRGIELIDQGIGKLVKGIELPILGFIWALLQPELLLNLILTLIPGLLFLTI
ncbi:MAG: LexA repressor [Candidatus Curtissbacteria bacterium GW2011_GWA1_40_47]|nr:MAG: LexA repressor [Candidatus Curtissbacteria bacterium GW2011_GWA1_40_47]